MVINAHDLGKTYVNGVQALKDLDLQVEKGQIFGFLGPNGAGKTTTIRLLNGTLTPTVGGSTVLGLASGDQDIRKRTATLGEQAKMYEHLSVRRNLEFFAELYDIPRTAAKDRIDRLLKRMGLQDRADDKLGGFSTGMKKRVQLARTLLHEPELLFLDEPTAGLDPEAALQVITLIRTLVDETGTTVFLCTHNLHLAEGVCDRFGLIKDGVLVASGSRRQLAEGIGGTPMLEVETAAGLRQLPLEDAGAINGHLRKLMDAGDSILSVNVREPSLEDAYFHYIGRNNNNEMV